MLYVLMPLIKRVYHTYLKLLTAFYQSFPSCETVHYPFELATLAKK